MKGRLGPCLAMVGLAAFLLIPGAYGGTGGGGDNGGSPSIQVLSNQANLVSGGDALVEVVLPGRVDPSTVRVFADGRDVTSAFAVRPDGRFLGVVTGLADGVDDLMATMRNGPT